MKIAVLIDAENISSRYVELILSEAYTLGNVIYKRIYANWTTHQMGSWKKVILDNSIQPMQQYSGTTGKNSSDSALIIDAMDLLYAGRINGFCIVTSDSDYTKLATRLRESEMYVLGMGEQKTPRAFISACSKFSYLDLLYSSSNNEKEPDERKLQTTDSTLIEKNDTEDNNVQHQPCNKESINEENSIDNLGSNLQIITQALKHIVDEKSEDDGWIFSGKLGGLIGKQFPDFDVRNFGYLKFVPFIESLSVFESKRDDKDTKLVYFKIK